MARSGPSYEVASALGRSAALRCPVEGVGFRHFSYRPVRFDTVCDPFLQQFYSQLRPTQGKSLQVPLGQKGLVFAGFFNDFKVWPGAGSNRRPSDFQSDARTN